ncbi:MAG TPA: hypothetical protein PK781_04145 [Terrimesophilobacter sp.]|nr:hypothetical protein [Terrimesophilobacter sp.]
MKIYSDFWPRRITQIAADALALLVISLGVWLGVIIGSAVASVAELGRQLRAAGEGFQSAMLGAGDALGQVPLVGDAVRFPFDSASHTGTTIADFGDATESFIETTGIVVGVVTALAVGLLVCWVWLRRRLVFIRRATTADQLQRLDDGHDLLALRALVNGTRAELAAISRNPVQGWRSGEPTVLRQLAALELREAGVRVRVRTTRPARRRPEAAR